MGMIDALVKSSERFRNEMQYQELAIGYDFRLINWVVEIDPSKNKMQLKGPFKDEIPRSVPIRADRSGKISKNNIKPNFLVDNASYALGISEGSTTKEAFKSFLKLHEKALDYLKKNNEEKIIGKSEKENYIKELESILDFLKLPRNKKIEQIVSSIENAQTEKSGSKIQKKGKSSKPKLPESNALIAYSLTSQYPFETQFAKDFWKKHLEDECADVIGTCSVCMRTDKKLLRILPFKIRLFGERCPLFSVNTDEQDSFGSLGKDQLYNSPICIECAGTADRLLKYLVQFEKDEKGKEKSFGKHTVVIQRDKNQSIGNQLAVFWTKEKIKIKSDDDKDFEFEDLVKGPLEDLDAMPEDEIPVTVKQCYDLLNAYKKGGKFTSDFPTNRFYLGIISPNKSRLVIREWLDESIIKVKESIENYMYSLQIIHPNGRGIWAPPMPALIEALQAYTSSKQEFKENPRIKFGPDVTKKLIRCIYTGTPPPEPILYRAVRCFRIPDPPTEDKKQIERQMLRRMSLAAAMKLILTYNKNEKEKKAMEQLKTNFDVDSEYKKKAPYNCGVLLAVLEEIQRKASSSGKGVNTTLVDRYYATASTAPATVFANLISMATKAHLPKLRKENKESVYVRYQKEPVNINDLLSEACKAIDDAGGFPQTLEPKQQAEFALGFYHQRAEFSTKGESKKIINQKN